MNQFNVKEVSGSLNTMHQLSKVRANLLELVDVLLTDTEMTREEVALDLVCEIDSLRTIEDDVVIAFRSKDLRNLHHRCNQISEAKDKKRGLSS